MADSKTADNRIVIKPAIVEQFRQWLDHGRVLFLSAPCGFGKTVVAETLLAGRSYRRVTGEQPQLEGSWQPIAPGRCCCWTICS